MAKFCEYCGKKLEEGEICTCQMEQEGELEYKTNDVAGKSYSFVSSPFMCLSIYRGRIYTDVDVDAEKLNIKMSPKRKNKIPTVYFKDIKEVNVSAKISIYSMFCAIFLVVLGFIQPICFLFGALWIWIAVNQRIRITLGDGNFVDIYSNAKAPAEEFANELSKVLY